MLADRLDTMGNVPRPGPSPSFSDVEVIVLTLTAGAAPPNTYLLIRRTCSSKRSKQTTPRHSLTYILVRSSIVADGLCLL